MLHEAAAGHVLFSGGIGMTPILSMAWDLHQLNRDFEWHISARSRERLAWSEAIDDLPFRGNIRGHLDDGPPAQLLDAPSVLETHTGVHMFISAACGATWILDWRRGKGGRCA